MSEGVILKKKKLCCNMKVIECRRKSAWSMRSMDANSTEAGKPP